jgi:hypothetical protein
VQSLELANAHTGILQLSSSLLIQGAISWILMGFALSDRRGHPLGVVLEIHKSVAVIQPHLKLPEHGKT